MEKPNDLTSALALINDKRQRILAGETIPPEELHEALALLRTNRSAASASAPKKAKKEKAVVIPLDLNSLFSPGTE